MSSACPLLSISPDVRIKILEYLLVKSPPPGGPKATVYIIPPLPPTFKAPPERKNGLHPNILSTCRVLLSEGLDLLYGQHKFEIDGNNVMSNPANFLASIGEDNVLRIRHLILANRHGRFKDLRGSIHHPLCTDEDKWIIALFQKHPRVHLHSLSISVDELVLKYGQSMDDTYYDGTLGRLSDEEVYHVAVNQEHFSRMNSSYSREILRTEYQGALRSMRSMKELCTELTRYVYSAGYRYGRYTTFARFSLLENGESDFWILTRQECLIPVSTELVQDDATRVSPSQNHRLYIDTDESTVTDSAGVVFQYKPRQAQD
jgi:hypothetical protein